jgi:hypothetical protein
MMREQHVNAEVLDRFARGDLDEAELSVFLHHLEGCDACAGAGQDRVADDLTALRTGWTDEAPETRRPVAVWTFAAAAAVALAVISLLLLPKERPSVPRQGRAVVVPQPRQAVPVPPATPPAERSANPEWQRAVARALASGRLPFPKDLDELRAPADTVRGAGGSAERIAPAGVVIDDVRPAFVWPSREGATYTVFVFEDDRKVLESPALQHPRWVAGRDLPRGRILTWQVEVTAGSSFETIPSPPAPPALFRIAKAADHEELVRARQLHPNDSMLLAVLYARSGMRAEALEALRRAAAGNESAKRILDHETSPAR